MLLIILLIIILLIIVLLFFCGGWGYNRRVGYVTGSSTDIVTAIIVIFLLWLICHLAGLI